MIIKMLNPSQEPLASSKAPNEDLKDVDVLCTFKIKIKSRSLAIIAGARARARVGFFRTGSGSKSLPSILLSCLWYRAKFGKYSSFHHSRRLHGVKVRIWKVYLNSILKEMDKCIVLFLTFFWYPTTYMYENLLTWSRSCRVGDFGDFFEKNQKNRFFY